MDLEWIKTFVTFAESESLEAVAHKLGVTQPAVTQHLAKLEALFPHPLFDKVGKRKVLSPHGKELYQQVRGDLRQLEDHLREIRFKAGSAAAAQIRLAIPRDIYYRVCDQLQFPGFLDVQQMTSLEGTKALLGRDVDVAVSRIVPSSNQIISVKWFSDAFAIVVPKTWEKEMKGKKLPDFLGTRGFISVRDSASVQEALLTQLGFNLVNQKNQLQLPDWMTTLKIIRAGRGWSLIPTSFGFDAKLQVIPIAPDVSPRTQFYILYHRGARKFPGFGQFLESLTKSMGSRA